MTDHSVVQNDLPLLQVACIVARERVRVADEALRDAQARVRRQQRVERTTRRRQALRSLADDLPPWLFGILHR